ncbi:MAG: helix-turn-helix domain-containing protein [candidate division WOR-3 bacterium]
MTNNLIIPIKVIEHYLNNGSLRKTAKNFNIHYNTLWKWVKIYKNQGFKEQGKFDERIFYGYRRPWNRIKRDLEEKIVLLKERDPALTLKKAKEILEKENIKISIKGIWGVWKRYGYAGFKKEKISNNFVEYVSWTKEAEVKFSLARTFFIKRELKKAGEILNSIPVLPKNEILKEIPDEFLNLKRKIEKILSLFGKVQVGSYIKRIKKLYKECLKRNLNYSALIIGLTEVGVLEWIGKASEGLKRIKELERILKRKKEYNSYLLFNLKFTLLIEKGILNAYLGRIYYARRYANLCKKILERKKISSSYLMLDIATLYTHIGDYRKAEYFFIKSIDGLDEENRKWVNYNLALILFLKGEYKKAKEISKNAYFGDWAQKSFRDLFYSLFYILKGELIRAIYLCNKAIKNFKKEELVLGMFYSYLTISACYSALGEMKKSKELLKRILFFCKNKGLKKHQNIINILLGKNKNILKLKKSNLLSSIYILVLLKKKKFIKAFSFAKKKGILGFFYQFIFFFPESIERMIKKGFIKFSKKILDLPVLNKENPVYEIKFLGKLKIYRREKGKNKRFLKINLSNRESAFIIHLALRINEPGKSIPLQFIYNNFFNRTKNPQKNFRRLLKNIKEKLKIRGSLIEINRRDKTLKNNGVYFITDYQEFMQALTAANTFLQAGEWKYAKREYLTAFDLFRGKPFEKMYDNLSEDMRTRIILRFESEIKNFIKAAKIYGDTKALLKIHGKIKTLIDNSQEE